MKFAEPSPRSIPAASRAGVLLAARLCTLAFFLGSFSPLEAQVAPAGRVAFPGSFRAVEAATATPAGKATLVRKELTDIEAAVPMRIEMLLKFRDVADLKRRVAAGETISRSEMESRYLPLKADYDAVSQWLTSQGLTVAGGGASHAVVIATGTPDKMSRAFQTSFARVNFRDSEYTAAVSMPSLPTDMEARVSNIHGLQPYLHPRKSSVARKAAATTEVEPPYMVSDILNAYSISTTGLTGAGQQIGIVIDSLPINSDLTQFWSANGVNQSLANIIPVNVVGGHLPSASGEETLDVSWSSAMAPGAQIIIYACGNLSDCNACYSQILDDLQSGSRPNLHQVSMSYGSGEITDETPDDMTTVNQLFTAITAYGVSLFAASGDDGAYGDGSRYPLQVLYPASDPNVTGVGGTTLDLSYTGSIADESGWTATGTRNSDNGSSGGGVSAVWNRPAWQVGGTVEAGTMRLVPDVAFAADPNFGCYLVLNGRVEQYGGTSWGSPCWAGLCALANQARATAGTAALAGANPNMYPALGTKGFRDIVSGNNGFYNAGTGFDLVTGLGVPVFNLLLPYLSSQAPTQAQSRPAITSPSTAGGSAGSAFTYQIAASNTPYAFSATPLPSGLAVDPTSGLISGSPTGVGTFSVTIGATNAIGTGTATLTLTVSSAPTVTMAATVPQVTLGSGDVGEITFSIPTALASDLLVYYTVKGSAINGTDYALLTGHAKIKAGRTSKVIKITPMGDLEGAGKKVIKFLLAPSSGYLVGTAGYVKVSILNE